MSGGSASSQAVQVALASAAAALLKDAALAEAMINFQDGSRRKEGGEVDGLAATPAASFGSTPTGTSPRDAALALRAELLKAAVLFSASSPPPSEEAARGFLVALCRASAATQLALRGAGGPTAGASLREAACKEASRLAQLSAAALRALADALGSDAAAASSGAAGQSASTRAVAAATTAAGEAAGKAWDDVSIMVSDLVKPLKVLDEAQRDLSEAIQESEEAAAGSTAAEPVDGHASDDGDFGASEDVLGGSDVTVAVLVRHLVVSIGKLVRRAAAALVGTRRGQSLDAAQLELWKAYVPLCARAARLGDAAAGESLPPPDPSRLGATIRRLQEIAEGAEALAHQLGEEHVGAVRAFHAALDAAANATEAELAGT